MKGILPVLIIGGGLLLTGIPAAAHHSFAATYDLAKEITLQGKMVRVSLRSPHSFFYVEVKAEDGRMHRWSFEGAGATQFAQQRVTRDSFKAGDFVEVVGNPAHSKTSYRARLIKITRPSDGKSWGSRPGEVVD
jgi:hypothetical protein